MFKKFCAIILSVCIAAAMILGANAAYSNSSEQNTVTMCIMDAEEESY